MSSLEEIGGTFFTALEETLLTLLGDSDGGMSEVELFNALDAQGFGGFSRRERGGDSLALFRCHFLLFHALYRLRDRLRAAREAELEIHTLRSRLLPYAPGTTGLAAGHDALRAYYLELDHLHETGEEELRALLEGFWRQVDAFEGRAQAFEALELSGDEPYEAVKAQYRRLAARHHPDRGGEAGRFHEIRSAFELLSRLADETTH